MPPLRMLREHLEGSDRVLLFKILFKYSALNNLLCFVLFACSSIGVHIDHISSGLIY